MEDTFREYDDALRHSTDSAELLKGMFEGLGYDRKALKTVLFNINTFQSIRAIQGGILFHFLTLAKNFSNKSAAEPFLLSCTLQFEENTN